MIDITALEQANMIRFILIGLVLIEIGFWLRLTVLAIPMQGINPILNWSVVYIKQGLTDDRAYLVSFFYPPVSTNEQPDSVEEEKGS
jgi:hypothetical protein